MPKKILILVTPVLLTAIMALMQREIGPVITESFASRRIKPGEPWEVYISTQIADLATGMMIFIFGMWGSVLVASVYSRLSRIIRTEKDEIKAARSPQLHVFPMESVERRPAGTQDE